MIAAVLLGLSLAAQAPGSPAQPGQLRMPSDPRWKAADAEMAGLWKRVYAGSKAADARETSRGGGPGYAASALGSQRAWLSYRDTQCVAVLPPGQVADWPARQTQCLIRLTQQRIAELKIMVRK